MSEREGHDEYIIHYKYSLGLHLVKTIYSLHFVMIINFLTWETTLRTFLENVPAVIMMLQQENV